MSRLKSGLDSTLKLKPGQVKLGTGQEDQPHQGLSPQGLQSKNGLSIAFASHKLHLFTIFAFLGAEADLDHGSIQRRMPMDCDCIGSLRAEIQFSKIKGDVIANLLHSIPSETITVPVNCSVIGCRNAAEGPIGP